MSRPDALERRLKAARSLADHSPNLFERIAAQAAIGRLERAKAMGSQPKVRSRKFGRLPADHRQQALICQSSPARLSWRERDFVFRMRYAEKPTPRQLSYLAALTRRALEVSA